MVMHVGLVSQNDCDLSPVESTLDSLSFRMVEEGRANADDISTIHRELSKASACIDFFTYPFEGVRAMSIADDTVGGIRIFTSMVNDPEVEGAEFYGGLYLRDESKWMSFESLDYLNIKSFARDMSTDKDWYGSIYYGVHPFKHEDRWHWVAFGYAPLDRFTGVKFLDILTYENERLLFGKPLFVNEDTGQRFNRVIFTYAAEAPMTLNYDSQEKKIVFDHLMPMKSLYQEGEITMVPDGSYSAYEWTGNYWRYIDMLEMIIPEETPRSQPILDKRKNRDIFGRSTIKTNGDKPSKKNNK